MCSVKKNVVIILKTQKPAHCVVPFLRQAAYYFEKGNYYYRQNKLEKTLLFFNKTVEVEPDNSLYNYNLACLLSRLGELDKANIIFSRIVNQLDPSLTECYFLMAVNYGMLDELEKARFYLNLYLHFAPDGEMAEDAEDLLYALSEDEAENLKERDSEREKLGKKLCEDEEEIIDGYAQSQAMRRLLWQGLYHENTLVVEKAIRMYGMLRAGSGEKNLKDFVRNPWIKQRMRIQALLVLKNMGFKGMVTVYMNGFLRDVDLSYYPLIAPRWLEQWQEVLDLTLENMHRSNAYGELFYEDAQAIWIDFINNYYPRMPVIKKKETWAAGLEYALARYHFLQITQKKLALQYGVSHSSISTRYQEINKVLNIEHRAYRNMLRYLTRRELD